MRCCSIHLHWTSLERRKRQEKGQSGSRTEPGNTRHPKAYRHAWGLNGDDLQGSHPICIWVHQYRSECSIIHWKRYNHNFAWQLFRALKTVSKEIKGEMWHLLGLHKGEHRCLAQAMQTFSSLFAINFQMKFCCIVSIAHCRIEFQGNRQ